MATNPPQPLWLTIVRGIQLLLALVTLGLSAYGISIAGNYAGYGLNIFTTIVTLFYIGYIVASTVVVPTLFNIWTSLMFQAFLSIFWLATFGTLAALSVSYAVVDEYDDYDDDDDYYYTYRGNNYDDISDYFRTAAATTKAATALAAVVWILFVATLIYTGTSPTPTKLFESPHLTSPSPLSHSPPPRRRDRTRRIPRAQARPRRRPANLLLPARGAICPAAAVWSSLRRPRRRIPPAAAVPAAAHGIPPAVPAANGLPTADC